MAFCEPTFSEPTCAEPTCAEPTCAEPTCAEPTCAEPMTPSRGGAPRRKVTVVPDGPILIEGPVELAVPNGETVYSDRFAVAVCQCRRSKRYPLCDASHRRRVRSGDPEGTRP